MRRALGLVCFCALMPGAVLAQQATPTATEPAPAATAPAATAPVASSATPEPQAAPETVAPRVVQAAAPVALAAPAPAPVSPAPAAAKAEDSGPGHRWSVGAGLALPLVTGVTPISTTVALPSVSIPSASVAIEYQVTRTNWLQLSGTAGSGKATIEEPDPQNADLGKKTDNSASRYAATLGLRHVFNPGGAVEIGGYGAFTLVKNSSDITATERRPLSYPVESTYETKRATEVETLSYNGTVGLTCDRELARGISLRIATSLFGVGYGKGTATSETTVTGAPYPSEPDKDEEKIDTMSYGLTLVPSIELRMLF